MKTKSYTSRARTGSGNFRTPRRGRGASSTVEGLYSRGSTERKAAGNEGHCGSKEVEKVLFHDSEKALGGGNTGSRQQRALKSNRELVFQYVGSQSFQGRSGESFNLGKYPSLETRPAGHTERGVRKMKVKTPSPEQGEGSQTDLEARKKRETRGRRSGKSVSAAADCKEDGKLESQDCFQTRSTKAANGV